MREAVLFSCSSAALVKGRVAGVEVLGIEVVLGDAKGVGETINMKYFTYTL